MVARGDLGMEIPPEKVFLAQKLMIKKANLAGKPVVTATQMLESMIKAPRPTRAEASDVANAILDGTDCVMLSGESANGDYPEKAVAVMAATCVEAEKQFNSQQHCADIGQISEAKGFDEFDELAYNTVKQINEHTENKAAFLVVAENTGAFARKLSKYRPELKIIALSNDEKVCNQLNACRGIIAHKPNPVTHPLAWLVDKNKEVLVISEDGSLQKVEI
jgi:pyruvate kinase